MYIKIHKEIYSILDRTTLFHFKGNVIMIMIILMKSNNNSLVQLFLGSLQGANPPCNTYSAENGRAGNCKNLLKYYCN